MKNNFDIDFFSLKSIGQLDCDKHGEPEDYIHIDRLISSKILKKIYASIKQL